MREPKRIVRILTLLFKIWEQQPDLRFNQLISNLQSNYLEQHNTFDLFYLEDDDWERFLRKYWLQIEDELHDRVKEITPEVINETINLFKEAGIDSELLTEEFRSIIKSFLTKESKWLTIDALLITMGSLSFVDRRELFDKIISLY